MQYTDELCGTLERFVYQNIQSGFAVGIIQTQSRETITVTGQLASLHPGESLTLKGAWISHPKFGKQFEVASCITHLPTSKQGLHRYLSSGLIKGIGPTYAEKLIEAFGTAVLEVIDKEPHRLLSINGLGPKRVERILEGWQLQKEMSHIMVFLQEKGLSTTYAYKIYKQYGNDAVAVIMQNPYRLAQDIWGIGFKTADTIALNMEFTKETPKRIVAGILHYLNSRAQDGHLYTLISQLKEEVAILLELEQADDHCKTALHQLYDERKIALITHNNSHYIGLASHYNAEYSVAHKIRLLHSTKRTYSYNIDTIYTWLRDPATSQLQPLNEQQQRAIIHALTHPVSIITGGPGTGKTTIIKNLITILKRNKIRFKLAAPTGRAAKRMSESTHHEAVTIHRLLEFDASVMRFTKNEQNALLADFIIIDESSMIDIFLAHALLKAIPSHAHLVFIGDTNQLPAVGAGNFLHDMITSEYVKTTQLSEVFRQSHNGMIISNAHRINNGEFPVCDTTLERPDFVFIKEQEATDALLHVNHIMHNVLKRYRITHDNTMLLTPMNRGPVGTFILNQHLQKELNILASPTYTHGQTTFKVGDRVMQIKNNYDKNIFNGDIGYIKQINQHDATICVTFADKDIEYETNELDELVLAYTITIHKSQGSEYDAVIIFMFMQHYTLLQRNLLYTAITRAKKLCILIGQPKAIAMAIRNNKSIERVTFLKEFLTSDLTCR